MDIEAVKSRVRKLMALANDGQASDGEISNAMRMAAALIDQHRLDAAALGFGRRAARRRGRWSCPPRASPSSIAKQRGDVFEINTIGGRAVFCVLSFYSDLSVEAIRVFPDSMRLAKRPTKVTRGAMATATACTLPDYKLARVLDLTASYRRPEPVAARCSVSIDSVSLTIEGGDDAAGDFAFDAARERSARR